MAKYENLDIPEDNPKEPPEQKKMSERLQEMTENVEQKN